MFNHRWDKQQNVCARRLHHTGNDWVTL